MTTSHYTKAFKQLRIKPIKLQKFLKHSSPKKRSCGATNYRCKRCGRMGGHISKYSLDFCRHCFREIATSIGFKQYK